MRIELLATSWVKLARLENIDNAQQEMARVLAQEVNKELMPAAGSAVDEGVGPSAAALALRAPAALPSAERTDTLERYRASLQRQIMKLLGEIEGSYKPRPSPAAPGVLGALGPPEISDATVVPPSAAH